MRKLHLFCNAHIDVIWQWKSAEAVATTLSTFRVAAELCEQHDNFVFNHNEALLYQWVEEYDPSLFARIQALVKQGKWKIVGGWTLQPDCLMPTGESFVRQMLYGRKYFREKFGVEPETAINFDSFGHARGLVQIMEQAGYKNYIFMRPESNRMALPQIFQWRGYDDESKIVAYKLNSTYATLMGHGAESVDAYIKENPDLEVAMRCWGIGNHGGGPSRQDVEDINALIEKYAGNVEIVHSNPDDFFEDKVPSMGVLPEVAEDLIPSWVGCYSTLVEIKQLHRKLENALLSAEKISVVAKETIQLIYPAAQLEEAYRCLAILQFHDVLPGTCTKPAVEEALRIGNYAMELAERIITKAMFLLTADEKPGGNGEIPVFVWNSHPYAVKNTVECEFMLADQNWEHTFTGLRAYMDGKEVPCQVVKEDSNFNLDWRKRLAIAGEFKPFSITRIDIKPYRTERPVIQTPDTPVYHFDNGQMQVDINMMTGLIDRFSVDGKELVTSRAFALEVFYDTADPWRIDVTRIDEKKGEFTLLNGAEAARMAGVKDSQFKPVRVIEDGVLFTKIEALFGYQDSRARIVYTLPKKGKRFGVDLTSLFAEKDTCLRLTIPMAMKAPVFRGQSVFGDKPLYNDGRESAAQQWISAQEDGVGIVVVNDSTYGSSNTGNLLRQTILRSSGYAGHPLPVDVSQTELFPVRPFMEYNRYLPRAEQGERDFHFEILGVFEEELIASAEAAAEQLNQGLTAWNIFPKGSGMGRNCSLTFSNEKVKLVAFKQAEDGKGYILRVFNPENITNETVVDIPAMGICQSITLRHHKVASYRIHNGTMTLCGLLE